MKASAKPSANGDARRQRQPPHEPARETPADLFGIGLPFNEQSEKKSVGCVLYEPQLAARMLEIMQPCDFHNPTWKAAFESVVVLADLAGGGAAELDPEVVYRELLKQGLADQLGGRDKLLADLLDASLSVSHAGDAMHYAREIHRLAIRRGAMLAAREIILRAAEDDADPAELVATGLQSFDALTTRTATDRRFEVLTAAELSGSEYSLEYLVEDVLVAAQPMILGGPQKVLKTMLALTLAVSLVSGAAFLGRFKVRRKLRALVMSAESGAATLQENLRRIAAAMDLDIDQLDGLFVCQAVPRFDSAEDLAELKKLLKRLRIDVLFIDPAYMAIPSGDTSNLFAQGELLRRVSELCERLGTTVVLLHHVKRAAGLTFDPIELADLSHAGFAEFARQWLLLGRREKYQPGSGLHKLWMTTGGSAGHNSLLALDVDERRDPPHGERGFRVEISAPEDIRRAIAQQRESAGDIKVAEQLAADKRRIANNMAKYPDGETKTQIRSAAAMSGTRFNAALASLLDDGAVVPVDVQKPKWKTPKEGYKLA